MRTIYVARHGQNEDNAEGILNGHRDRPLTEIGRGQARELAGRIREARLEFDAVYCSPLVRASETARIVAELCGLPTPRTMPALVERDFGIMTGKPVASIRDLCAPDIIETDTVTYFLHPEGAEDFDRPLARAKAVLEAIHAAHWDGNILLVAHGDIGKMLVAAHFGIPWREALVSFHFGNSELLKLGAPGEYQHLQRIRLEQHNH